jgi:ACT domain-containing protein
MAGVCVAFEKANVNVLDINQTILKDMFTMNMLVDMKNANVSFSEMVDILDREGERLGVNIRIQREDIFDAMHRI